MVFKLPKLHYLRIFILLLAFMAAYAIFSNRNFLPFHNLMIELGIVGAFLAGGFYAYGFTAAPATAVLLSIAKEQNIIIAAMAGGLGALIGDMLLFYLARHTFKEEIGRVSKTKVMRFIDRGQTLILGRLKKHVLLAFAGFFIASPLPTEIGVTMMASLNYISMKKFAVIAYVLHTTGIIIILAIGRII